MTTCMIKFHLVVMQGCFLGRMSNLLSTIRVNEYRRFMINDLLVLSKSVLFSTNTGHDLCIEKVISFDVFRLKTHEAQ